MNVLVVCGAGASSTFVALRMRKTAAERGTDAQITAGTSLDLPTQLVGVDVLLVGPHLAVALDDIRAQALSAGVAMAVLPSTIFTERDGTVALDLALDTAGAKQ